MYVWGWYSGTQYRLYRLSACVGLEREFHHRRRPPGHLWRAVYWRMGEGFGMPWAITRGMGGVWDILGNREWEVKGGDSDALGDREGTQRCGGGDWDAQGDRERNCRLRGRIRTPCTFARAIGGRGRGLGRTGQSQGEWEIGGVN